MNSIVTRVQSHIVVDIKASIKNLYYFLKANDISALAMPKEIAEHITYLLDKH